MSLSEAVSSVLSKPVDFSGRARRSEYWWWALAVAVGYLVLGLLATQVSAVFWVVDLFFLLLVLVPSLAVTWRRLHDTGRSGAWWFIGFVPVVGGIIVLVFTILDSQPGPNEYGPNPKDAPANI
jgi:uncharacterized membrane protein YhaH (DUF805 family)